MQALAHWNDGGGPGPWVLLFPLIWAAVIAGGIVLLRRTVWRGRGGPRGPWRAAPGAKATDRDESPLGVLDRRFAQGEIDEDEYWRRFSVLNESARDRQSGGSTGGAA
ncbi:SHOCT domain-containing protein [Streptomyces boncukensis]|uniref:SHOCT domain-containing protein n=1 Tax=Streptomyces boncukensis TaxID=2711219 RepID=A0A6G4WXR2_9ACTN|nr:SHOCT domain-containing protein [Streptomyces boncukensis]NGO70076.1 SHOCT domain-containing protein [Streptomyces boncukensis]